MPVAAATGCGIADWGEKYLKRGLQCGTFAGTPGAEGVFEAA
jgi:hypothetical protein